MRTIVSGTSPISSWHSRRAAASGSSPSSMLPAGAPRATGSWRTGTAAPARCALAREPAATRPIGLAHDVDGDHARIRHADPIAIDVEDLAGNSRRSSTSMRFVGHRQPSLITGASPDSHRLSRPFAGGSVRVARRCALAARPIHHASARFLQFGDFVDHRLEVRRQRRIEIDPSSVARMRERQPHRVEEWTLETHAPAADRAARGGGRRHTSHRPRSDARSR